MKFLLAILLPLITLSVFAQSGPAPSVTIRWVAPTTMDDGSPIPSNAVISYNLYGGHTPTGPWSTPIPILGTSTIRNGVDTGQLCYYVTTVVNGKESLPTTPQCVNVTPTPSTIPNPPTNVTIVEN